ncbi:polysaccharide deacetylase family protein [Vibrio sp. Of7-15]|uniref:polysaccharide deacetylase family protein n=1 Tax=Vibrio sp. Of7-15 TaxID=2724879 RepID=UPI001EF267EF|nr:polysaccharide deacetylase family protein [Vibrio sp. Of7-15]MCG7499639.1 polysaccharide deacetylase family protein [Vibrio sp. Of7-15]
MRALKHFIYHTLYYTGIQRLCSYINRHKVSILCFHSVAQQGENEFWPGVFISKPKLHEILNYLQDSRYQVISLQEAKRHLKGEVKYKYPVVLTIDDGWYASVVDMLPILERYRFPSTLYVTTYYVSHQIPVVNVLVQYLIWKTGAHHFTVTEAGETYSFSGQPQEIVAQVEAHLNGKSDPDKLAFLESMVLGAGLDKSLINNKLFQNASFEELRQADLANQFANFQLHTHGHQLPLDAPQLRHQIEKNKALLEAELDCQGALNDFCYPSGIWEPGQIPHIDALGIESATTLDEGLNAIGDHPLTLKRNLVMDSRSLLHLKLALSGTFDVFRQCKPS